MTFSIPAHRLSVEPGDVWVPDPIIAGSEHIGGYVRSREFGVYLNVRSEDPGPHPLTKDGLVAILREQNWGPSIDEWSAVHGKLTVVGGSFEAPAMRGEIVLEIYVTDGQRLVNFAGPGPREVIAKLRPSAERLAATVRLL